MRIAFFTPYGPASQETGIMYLLASALKAQYPETSQLRCNGVFAVCDKDVETNWRRDFSQCFQCIADQQHLQRWSSINSLDLSQFVSPEMVEQSRKVLNEIKSEQLIVISYQGFSLFELAKDAFLKRTGTSNFDPANRKHDQVLRNLYAAAIRMYEACNSYLIDEKPNYLLTPKSSDVLGLACMKSALGYGTDLVTFGWDVQQRAVIITRELSGKQMKSELLLDGVSKMRADQKTWPTEITCTIEDIVSFLDLQEAQLELPIGKASAA